MKQLLFTIYLFIPFVVFAQFEGKIRGGDTGQNNVTTNARAPKPAGPYGVLVIDTDVDVIAFRGAGKIDTIFSNSIFSEIDLEKGKNFIKFVPLDGGDGYYIFEVEIAEKFERILHKTRILENREIQFQENQRRLAEADLKKQQIAIEQMKHQEALLNAKREAEQLEMERIESTRKATMEMERARQERAQEERVNKRTNCPHCRGTSRINKNKSCDECNGEGFHYFARPVIQLNGFGSERVNCTNCSGSGRITGGQYGKQCPLCRGSGIQRQKCNNCNTKGIIQFYEVCTHNY